MSVDLEALEKLCDKQTFTAYGSEVLLGSLADEVPGLIAELRALRAERDALRRQMEAASKWEDEAQACMGSLRAALKVAVETLDECKAQWGSEYLWSKWGIDEQIEIARKALRTGGIPCMGI